MNGQLLQVSPVPVVGCIRTDVVLCVLNETKCCCFLLTRCRHHPNKKFVGIFNSVCLKKCSNKVS